MSAEEIAAAKAEAARVAALERRRMLLQQTAEALCQMEHRSELQTEDFCRGILAYARNDALLRAILHPSEYSHRQPTLLPPVAPTLAL